MAKTSSIPHRDGLQCDRLPWKRALPLVAALRPTGAEARAVPASEAAGRAEHADGEEGVAALTDGRSGSKLA